MSSDLKAKCRSTCSGLSILLVIGLTFGLLYAMDRLLMSNNSICTKEQGLRIILRCSTNFTAQVVDEISSKREQDLKHEDDSTCRYWQLYLDCLEAAAKSCKDDGTMRKAWKIHNSNIEEALPGCTANSTAVEEHR